MTIAPEIKPLGELTAEQFLKEYWQKKPLVIRNAFPDFESPITPDELAGLACEEGVNSRIVIEKAGDHPWQPIYGPLDEDVFTTLPETHWTLLVNDVDKHLPELAWIVDEFRFIPEWRLDDLMISYATEGGSVGPHMDQYDVFILQAKGHRHWGIDTRPVAADNQVEDTPLRIQKTFNAEQEWLLAPGDIIYIPPGVSHHGIAADDCMSYSIGFRAISHSDMVNDFIGLITQQLDTSCVYTDVDLAPQDNPNEITPEAIERIRKIFTEYLDPDHPMLKHWIGRFMSDPKTDSIHVEEFNEEISHIMDEITLLYRHPGSRFAYIREGDQAMLFIDGDEYQVYAQFAETLCHSREVDIQTLKRAASEADLQLLTSLIQHGKLVTEL